MPKFLNEYMDALDSGISRASFAKKLGLSERQLKRKLEKIRNKERRKRENVEESIYDTGDSSNERYVSSKVERIDSLDQLLSHCKVDLSVWEIFKHEINKWEGYRKRQEKDLVYDDGKATGYVKDKGDLFIAPLFQIKVWLVRKEPIEIYPVVKPIVFSSSVVPPKRVGLNRKYETRLINPDSHFGFTKSLRTGKLTPFHDRKALDISLQVAELLGKDLTEILWLGDIHDMAQWTDKFVRTPEFQMTMQPAVFESSWWLYQNNQLARQKVLQGNHDLRLETALMTSLSYAYDLRSVEDMNVSIYPALSIPNLLGMDKMGIEWIDGYPDNRYWINDRLCVEHGNVALANPGYTSYKMIDKKDFSTIFGHIHRREYVCRNKKDRSGNYPVEAICPGFLGHVDGRIPGQNGKEWSQGILVVRSREDGWYDFELVRIDDGVGFYSGEYIVGKDRTEEIESHTEVGF